MFLDKVQPLLLRVIVSTLVFFPSVLVAQSGDSGLITADIAKSGDSGLLRQ